MAGCWSCFCTFYGLFDFWPPGWGRVKFQLGGQGTQPGDPRGFALKLSLCWSLMCCSSSCLVVCSVSVFFSRRLRVYLKGSQKEARSCLLPAASSLLNTFSSWDAQVFNLSCSKDPSSPLFAPPQLSFMLSLGGVALLPARRFLFLSYCFVWDQATSGGCLHISFSLPHG